MKLIKQFKNFHINENKKEIIKVDSYYELEAIINDEITLYGPNVDLNHIDTSNVTNMSTLFKDSKFNGNISNWNVSNVKDMSEMFYNSKFNGDISKWNVSNVRNMTGMFGESLFSGDISKWDIVNSDITDMFTNSKIPIYNLPKVLNGKLYKLISIEEFEKYQENKLLNLTNLDNDSISSLKSIFKNTPSIYKNTDFLTLYINGKEFYLYLIDDDYYIILYDNLYFICDGLDGLEEFIKNWNIVYEIN